MSLDQAIKHGKEKRKPYRGSKAVAPCCRNHGNCTYCQMKRERWRKVFREIEKDQEKD